MTRKASKPQQDQAISQPETGPEKSAEVESVTGTEQKAQSSEKKEAAKTTVRMVEAKLKTRHCHGGLCKEAGETMRMTQGEYDRLKKYDRVE